MLAAATIAHGTRKEIAPSSRRALVPQAHRHLCVSPADLVGEQIDIADSPDSANFNCFNLPPTRSDRAPA